MLINLRKICSDYGVGHTGVLHIGAHTGEERESYRACGFTKVVWVEANRELAEALERAIAATPDWFESEVVLHCAIFDVDGENRDFYVTNNRQSSSLLELGEHRKIHPEIDVVQTLTVQTRRIDRLFAGTPALAHGLAFANLDIQGVELPALRSFGEFLGQFRWVYTEVNRAEVYKTNALIWEIDRWLLQHRFVRCETVFTPANWGDALYVKRERMSGLEHGWRIGQSYLTECAWRLTAPSYAALKRVLRRAVGPRAAK